MSSDNKYSPAELKKAVKEIRGIYSDVRHLQRTVSKLERIALIINQFRLGSASSNLISTTSATGTTGALNVSISNVRRENLEHLTTFDKQVRDAITTNSSTMKWIQSSVKLNKQAFKTMDEQLIENFLKVKVERTLADKVTDFTEKFSGANLLKLGKLGIMIAPLVFELVNIAISEWQKSEEERIAREIRLSIEAERRNIITSYGNNIKGQRAALRSLSTQ